MNKQIISDPCKTKTTKGFYQDAEKQNREQPRDRESPQIQDKCRRVMTKNPKEA